jgi:hypothetical protein
MAIRWFSTWSWPSALGLADIATGPQAAEKREAEEKGNQHGKETKSNYLLSAEEINAAR